MQAMRGELRRPTKPNAYREGNGVETSRRVVAVTVVLTASLHLLAGAAPAVAKVIWLG